MKDPKVSNSMRASNTIISNLTQKYVSVTTIVDPKLSISIRASYTIISIFSTL